MKQLNIQANSVCSGTCDCKKIIDFLGSTPWAKVSITISNISILFSSGLKSRSSFNFIPLLYITPYCSLFELPSSVKFEFIEGDITKIDDVNKAVEGIDIVIHLAAIINPYDPALNSVNIDGTRNLVEAAKKFKIKKFVLLSTENVLLPYQTAYSKSKIKAEKIVRALKNYVIIRPTVVYGEGDNKNLTSIIKMVERMPIIIIPGSGENKLQPIYVKDLALAIKNSLSKSKGEYIVAGSSFISLNKIISIVEEEMGIRKIKIKLPLFILYPAAFILERLFSNPAIRYAQIQYLCSDHIYNVRKAIKDLKYSPISIEEGIKKII